MDKYKLTSKGRDLMNKHSLAQDLLEAGYTHGKTFNLEEKEVAEVMITAAIEELVRIQGADLTRDYLGYELESIFENEVSEVQRGPSHS
jgi:hypothetical protein